VPETTGARDLLVAILVADAEVLLSLVAEAIEGVPSAVAGESLERIRKAVSVVLSDAPAPPAPAPPEPSGRLARIEVKGFRDLGVVRVTEVTLAGELMVHAERTPWSSAEFTGDAADFPASSLHFVTWLPETAAAVMVASPQRAVTSGAVRSCGCGPAEFCEDCGLGPPNPF
jgi:hypothetical protein